MRGTLCLRTAFVFYLSARPTTPLTTGFREALPPFTHVKSPQRVTLDLLREGYDRSVSFRLLVDRIQASNAIVLVYESACRGGRVRSCLTSVMGNSSQRLLKIKVDPHGPTDRLIATMGHELQHAVELIEDPRVTDAQSALALYRQIGTAPCQAYKTDACETDLALETEARILGELYDSPRRAKNPPCTAKR